jgi:hypothetical protein
MDPVDDWHWCACNWALPRRPVGALGAAERGGNWMGEASVTRRGALWSGTAWRDAPWQRPLGMTVLATRWMAVNLGVGEDGWCQKVCMRRWAQRGAVWTARPGFPPAGAGTGGGDWGKGVAGEGYGR